MGERMTTDDARRFQGRIYGLVEAHALLDCALADLIAARERIDALEAERDARVTVEEHARAVREEWLDARDANDDNADDRAHFWSVSHVRRGLIATLTRHVGPKRAAELADGVGGDL